MRASFGLRLREEIHASAMINTPGPLVRIKRNDRLSILRFFADELATMTDLNIINVVIDKQSKAASYDVFGTAWRVYCSVLRTQCLAAIFAVLPTQMSEEW